MHPMTRASQQMAPHLTQIVICWQVADKVAGKAKDAAPEAYRTATDYASSAYDKVRPEQARGCCMHLPLAAIWSH